MHTFLLSNMLKGKPNPDPGVRLFMDGKRVQDPVVRQHLELDTTAKPELSVRCLPYDRVYSALQEVCSALSPKDKVWISDKASCALTQAIPKVRHAHTHTHAQQKCMLVMTCTFNQSVFISIILKPTCRLFSFFSSPDPQSSDPLHTSVSGQSSEEPYRDTGHEDGTCEHKLKHNDKQILIIRYMASRRVIIMRWIC